MDAEPLERTQYDGAPSGATTRRAESRRDTEAYWRPRARMAAGPFGAGVVSGLALTAGVGEVLVGQGVALDGAGELISLAAGGFAATDTGLLEVAATGVAVALPGPGRWVVTVGFREAVDVEYASADRVLHTPRLAVTAEGELVAGDPVELGVVTVGADGAIEDVHRRDRQAVGLSVRGVDLLGGGSPAGRVADGRVATVHARDDGVGVRVGDGPDQLSVGAVTAAIRADTTVAGSLAVSGAIEATDLRVAGRASAEELAVGGRATVEGELAVGAGVALSGRHALRGDDPYLRLNPVGAFGGGVYTPGLLSASRVNVGHHADPGEHNLNVVGSVDVGGYLRVGGDVSVGGRNALRGNDDYLRLDQDGAFPRGVHTPRLFTAGRAGIGDASDPGHLNLQVGGNLRVLGKPADTALGMPTWSGGGLVAWDVFVRGGLYVGTDTANPVLTMDRSGGVSARIKNFRIPHPTDGRRDLVHGCVEGPEHTVTYRGRARLAAGRARVALPAYFEALTRAEGRTVQVTPVLDEAGTAAALGASVVRDGAFTVAVLGEGPRAGEFCWQVTAVRADVDPLEVEPLGAQRRTANAVR